MVMRSTTSLAKARMSIRRAPVGADAARTQIKKRLVVQLADGRAVGAFDIVGKNLQLRFGVDDGVLREDEIAIGLLGVGFLGVLPDENFAVENAVRAVGQDAVIKFVAFAMRLGVIDDGVMIDQLFVARQDKVR